MTTAITRELEQLLGRLRYAKAGQTNHDMWEHYGAGSATDEQRAQMEAELAECNKLYSETQIALEVLVAKLRAEAPDEVTAWANAHDAYLAWVIEDHIARGDAENSQVDTARRERSDWAKVRSGELAFVNESIYYAPDSNERYRQLFGCDLRD